MQTYPREVDVAIWELAVAGETPARIHEVLRSGQAKGLGYAIQMPRRTLTDKLRRLKEKHGDPRTYVLPGEEEGAIGDLRRIALGIANREVDRLATKDLSARDVDCLRKCLRVAFIVEDAVSSGLKDPQRRAAARARHRKPSEAFLADLVEKLQGEG